MGKVRYSKEQLDEVLEPIALELEENEWETAVKDECSLVFLDWGKMSPREIVEKLIETNCHWALDPAISKAANDLIELGRQQVLKELINAKTPESY